MTFSGYSSATRGSGFVVKATNALNQVPGLLIYGVNGRAAIPFQGASLCVHAPIKRTTAVNSGGTPSPVNDCSGVFSLDMNSFALGNLGGLPSAALQLPGTMVVCQWWGRDPGLAPPLDSQLSAGLEFQVCP
jgi:hypothetical protein